MKKVLIISHLYEPSVNAVIREFKRMGVDWVRFNTETFPLLSSGSIEATNDSGITGFIEDCNGSRICLNEIGAVWFRRMGRWTLPRSLSGYDLEYAETECRSFIQGFFNLTRSIPWTNDPDCERLASSKIFQLQQARAAGFNIPRTLITNSTVAARKFFENTKAEVIFKPLSGVSAAGADFSRELLAACGDKLVHEISVRTDVETVPVVFANILTEEHLEHLDTIQFSPTLFQERITKSVELRITVVGEEVFCAEIHSQEFEETSVDFRRMSFADNGKIPVHKVHRLPNEIESMVVCLMRQLGLDFGCLDLILTPNGQYVFLEVNPNGQWLWIEKLTRMRITEAYATLLAEKSRAPARREQVAEHKTSNRVHV